MYSDILRRLWGAVRRKRPGKCRTNSWFLLHDNAPAHRSVMIKDFLAEGNVTTPKHPIYSPDLAPAHVFACSIPEISSEGSTLVSCY